MSKIYFKILISDLTEELLQKSLVKNPYKCRRTTDGKYILLTFLEDEAPLSAFKAGYTPISSSEIKLELQNSEWDSEEKPPIIDNRPNLSPNTKRPEVIVVEAEGSFKAIVSHDFNDKCTWYQNSQEIIGENLTHKPAETPLGKVYESSNSFWIDMTHGRHAREYELAASYPVKIYDDGIELVENQDFSIDYSSGKVILDENYTANGNITADYWYATNSEFILGPDSGKILKIEHAEIDFSDDTIMSPVSFQIWAYNPVDPPNKIKVDEVIYKNEKDVLKIANTVQHISKWGVMANDVKRCEFVYSRTIDLKSSLGLELRIRILNDTPFGGGWSTATFYTSSENE